MTQDKRYLFIDTHRLRKWDGGIYQHFPKAEKLLTTGLEAGPPDTCDARGPTLYGTVLKEDGLFRMWYGAKPDAHNHAEHPDHFYSCYAESDDGIHWHKPDLKITGQKRFPGNNLLSLPGVVMGVVHALPGTDAKYLAVVMQYGIEEDISEGFGYEHSRTGTYIYASDDGLHWRQHMPQPAASYGDVCCLIADPQSNRYLLYQKVFELHGLHTRRAFICMDSTDGVNWNGGTSDRMTPWRESIQCDDYDDLQAMQAGYLLANHYDLAVYRAGKTYISIEDIFQMSDPLRKGYTSSPNGCYMFRLGFSHDGMIWRYPKGRPAWLTPGAPGEWDAGFAVNASTFVEHDDHLMLHYTASPYFHGWAINTDFSQREDIPLEAQRATSSIMVARIRKDRFASLAANYQGTFSVDGGPRDKGETLTINARCPKGRIRVAATTLSGNKTLPGLTFDDCNPFTGDSTASEITFRNAHLSDVAASTSLMLHFEITSGEIFGYNWTPRAN